MKLWKYARPAVKNHQEWSQERSFHHLLLRWDGGRILCATDSIIEGSQSITDWIKYTVGRGHRKYFTDKTYPPGRKIKKRRRRQGRTGCCRLSQSSSDPADCHPVWQPLSCSLHLPSLPDSELVTATNTQGKRLSSSWWQDLCWLFTQVLIIWCWWWDCTTVRHVLSVLRPAANWLHIFCWRHCSLLTAGCPQHCGPARPTHSQSQPRRETVRLSERWFGGQEIK